MQISQIFNIIDKVALNNATFYMRINFGVKSWLILHCKFLFFDLVFRHKFIDSSLYGRLFYALSLRRYLRNISKVLLSCLLLNILAKLNNLSVPLPPKCHQPILNFIPQQPLSLQFLYRPKAYFIRMENLCCLLLHIILLLCSSGQSPEQIFQFLLVQWFNQLFLLLSQLQSWFSEWLFKQPLHLFFINLGWNVYQLVHLNSILQRLQSHPLKQILKYSINLVFLSLGTYDLKIRFFLYKNLIEMKQTSKDKIINESLADKIEKARDLKRQNKHWEAIQAYHKALYLKEDPQYYFELAQIYEKILDLTSANLFYRRTHQLNNSPSALQKVKNISKIQGLQLLSIGSVKNILEDTEFQTFAKRYSHFHKRLMKKVDKKGIVSDYLQSAMAFLEVNQRQLALSEVENCIMIDENDADLVVLRAMLYWSMLETGKGYKQFWSAYRVDKNNNEVELFLEMITPEIQKIYKQAKYDLIDRKLQKCKLKVKKGLQIHPYHTQLLILSAYLHRTKEDYQTALSQLQLANKYIEDNSLEAQLKSQISLTFNQMGISSFKQGRFDESCRLFTEGLTYNPKDWGMLTNRGDCYRSLNDFVKALDDYLGAYESEKKNDDLTFRIASIYNIRGVALFNSKNYQLAIKEFEQAVKFSPRCAQFFLSKAKCLLQVGSKSQAIEALQRCFQLDDKQVEAGQMLSQLKDPQQRKSKNNRKVIILSKQK